DHGRVGWGGGAGGPPGRGLTPGVGKGGKGDWRSPPAYRLIELEAPWRHPELIAQVDAIFWQTAARTLAPGAERDAFRERWLGRYLEGGSDVVLVALAGGTRVGGSPRGGAANPPARG